MKPSNGNYLFRSALSLLCFGSMVNSVPKQIPITPLMDGIMEYLHLCPVYPTDMNKRPMHILFHSKLDSKASIKGWDVLLLLLGWLSITATTDHHTAAINIRLVLRQTIFITRWAVASLPAIGPSGDYRTNLFLVSWALRWHSL